jgi:lysophospholipid acyltransferase (LPLAT)-like uncharacterized protein
VSVADASPRRARIDDAEVRRRVYSFGDLSRFPLKRRVLIRLADLGFWCVIALIGRTVRCTAVGREHLDALDAAGQPYVGAFWHNRVFLSTWFFRRRGIVVMTSESFDGEYIARFIQRFGYGAARGSSTRGGRRALVLMRTCLRAGLPTAFTIDGPRGPVYVAKEGAIALARAAGVPVLPVSVSAERFWTVKSWDRFQIPRPFTRAVVLIAPVIWVPHDCDDAELARKQAALQAALDELRARGDGWWK